MAYVTIPKDLTKVKSKVMFGLTKRQLICFGAAALIGVPLFFLLKSAISSSAATLCSMKIDAQKKAVREGFDMDILPTDLATYAGEAKNILRDLQSRNERMFLRRPVSICALQAKG